MQTISFQQALGETRHRRRHLLLGNGFSVALHRRFSYESLYKVACRLTPGIADLFEWLDTRNFEVALAAAADGDEARLVRNALVKAVTNVHPYKATTLTEDEYASCADFLADFVGLARDPRRGHVFTTNYDMLLYWTCVQHNSSLRAYDGCDNRGEWSSARAAQVFQLHGGLQWFATRDRAGKPLIEKVRYEPGRPVLEQVRGRLERNSYPIFVTEGSATEKSTRIGRSPYLKAAQKAFKAALSDRDATLFTVGHSLSVEDQHICDLIGSGSVGMVFVGCFSGDDEHRARALAREWSIERRRAGRPPCEVFTFDVRECAVWTRQDVSLFIPRGRRKPLVSSVRRAGEGGIARPLGNDDAAGWKRARR